MSNRAVSPLMGNVLLIAMVLIIASGIGVFALGYAGNLGNSSPQADIAFEWDKSTQTLIMSHDGGSKFTESNTNRLEVVIHDDDGTGGNNFLVARSDWASQSAGGFPVTSGDTFRITGESGGGDLDVEQAGTDVSNPVSRTHEPEIGDTVEIIWHGQDDQSAVVAEYVITSGRE